MDVKASMLLTPSVPSTTVYEPRRPHPKNNRNHPSCPTTLETAPWIVCEEEAPRLLD